MSEAAAIQVAPDVSGCEREPIHVPGAIQPHGLLLAVERGHYSIVQYAGDPLFLLGVAPARLTQLSLSSVIEQHAALQIAHHMQSANEFVPPLVMLGIHSRAGAIPLDVVAHAQGERVIVELEPSRRTLIVNGDPLTQVRTMLGPLAEADSVAEVCAKIAQQVRAAIDFDRVCVYRFHPDLSGEVVAEDRAEGVESFLGLHYPASDIPPQARELYRRNWLRLIPDIDYTPSPLMPAHGTPLDMTHCTLRSVSPVHIEYLRHMGVSASLSLSIVIKGALWGLVACHNYAPRYVAMDMRIACELYAQMLSLKLEAQLEADAARGRAGPRRIQRTLAARLPLAEDAVAELLRRDVTLLDLIPANGVAVQLDGRLDTLGVTPPPACLQALLAWLAQSDHEVYSTDQLGSVFPPAAPYADIASGLLAICVSRASASYVLWFRPELSTTVRWAGNPDKPVIVDDGGARLSPRHSFAEWCAEVRGRSAPWSDIDIETVNACRIWLLEVVLEHLDEARRERESLVARQNVLLAELDHRVKNTLASIDAIVQQTKHKGGSLESFVEGLQNRIRAMAYAHGLLSQSQWEGAEIRQMVVAELAPYCHDAMDNVQVSGENVMLTATAAMSFNMVLHELTTNAAKYGALSVPGGRVNISWQRADDDGRLLIDWRESGGPPVTPPTRRGFGSSVIERTLRYELRGETTVSYAREGVHCLMVVPAEHLVARGADESRHG